MKMAKYQQMTWEKAKEYNQTLNNPWFIKHVIGKVEKFVPMYNRPELTEEEEYYFGFFYKQHPPKPFEEFATLEDARQYVKSQLEKNLHDSIRASLMFESDVCGMMNSCEHYHWYL
jgi:hypothetical protein